MQDEFNDVAAIDLACALKEMVGVDVSPQELRAHYKGADDEMIFRIVDTLHVYRFDWMEQAEDRLPELLSKVDKALHVQVLEEAQELAFMRLKHIGFLQQSGQYLKDLEEDILREGQDRFPELYDASDDAEAKTRHAIGVVVPMVLEAKRQLGANASNDNTQKDGGRDLDAIRRSTLYGPTLYG